MCSALQTVHNDGGWKEEEKRKLNCNRIDLFKYNNRALQRSEEEARAPRQRLTGSMKPQAVIDKLLAQCEAEHTGMLSNSSGFTRNKHHTYTPDGLKRNIITSSNQFWSTTQNMKFTYSDKKNESSDSSFGSK